MHRRNKLHLGIVKAFRVKHGLFKYCSCGHCQSVGGTWRQNHSSLKYVTPSFLRAFDGIRSVFEGMFA